MGHQGVTLQGGRPVGGGVKGRFGSSWQAAPTPSSAVSMYVAAAALIPGPGYCK